MPDTDTTASTGSPWDAVTGADAPTFYDLPAAAIEEGMSTDDGQDVVAVTVEDDGWVFVEVYTPRSDDPDQDTENRDDTETRMHRATETVGMATFTDTEVDGSTHPMAGD